MPCRLLVMVLSATLIGAIQISEKGGAVRAHGKPGKPSAGRNALLTVCFSSKSASPKRHSAEQLTDGCLLNIASFKMARPDADVLVIAPTEDMVAKRIKKVAQKDPSIKLATVGMGPWSINGQSIPFTNKAGSFFGNSLKLLWYTQVLTENAGKYEHVFISDGTDVFFQRDVFQLVKENPLADIIFFGDRNDQTNKGKEFFNRMMPKCSNSTYKEASLLSDVQKEFTQKVVTNRMGNNITYGVYANSGLILGKASAVLELTRKVAEIAAECHYWTSDQSIVNLVRYYEMKRRGADKVLIFPDMNKTVSMGKYTWRHFTEDSWLANKIDRERLYVVHQYDRSPMKEEVTALAWQKMAGWIRDHEK